MKATSMLCRWGRTAICCMAAAGAAQAATLTNADILKMVDSGVPDTVILQAITKNGGKFDTSADALIALRHKGASTSVLQAVVNAGTAPVSAAAPAASAPQTLAAVPATPAAAVTASADAAEMEIAVPPTREGETPVAPPGAADFCFLRGGAPSDYKYTVVRKLKVGKGTYGSVKDVVPVLADKARGMGGDAIINYNGSQRFGFFPWRMVRPVVSGTAIRWDEKRDRNCAAMGGQTLQDILNTPDGKQQK